MLTNIKNSLKELGFSTNEIKVYIALTQTGESTAAQIAKKIDLPRTTVIGILIKLGQERLITTNKYRGKIFYWIESPKILQEIYENKIKIARQIEKTLADLYHTEKVFPTAKVYDTKSAIKKFIESTLLALKPKDIIYTIDSPNSGNYRKIFSFELGSIMYDIKNKRQITTKTLIPSGTYRKIEPIKLKKQNIIVRELPPGIDFLASLWLIGDLLVHFSGQPPFVVAIRNKTIWDSQKSVYEYLWAISESKI